ncbi:hypothetical protein SAMN05216266_10663 [Amycolatopsis marina]|uniref:Uncharacterized protein n=1 Tax=Amycolatopsis marina TaxID=490629 RepID=A0A1I0Z284_9PSEU|nr:hypothetical protein [Amycolatopsis marina]SFB19829.1 hypothetical protein SAMN05216266_10663 [Amycolatopsis marina]
MNTRIAFKKHAPSLPCERCGYESLTVAALIDEDGSVIGQTLVCTTCRERRRAAATGSVPVQRS